MRELIERLRTPLSVSMFASKDHMINALLSERGEAAAALEAAQEDAERYRWLRERMVAEEIVNKAYAELDAAIDQARGKGGQEVES